MNRARRILHAQIQPETIAGVFACLGVIAAYALVIFAMRMVLALGWYVGA
ncbi:hypothetical protein NY08_2460 [Rhodococcus sp. B7740]|nr:hypothetical protein [Rhodococcus sp. B7740]AJW40483.1 hypothetical protein NY08_2460 [Rhodococcus sp. B7740]